MPKNNSQEQPNSFSQKANEYAGFCPHLGLLMDSQTCYRTPSPRNYCHYVKEVSPVHIDHQTEFCLGDYQQCPVLLEGLETLPKTGQGKVSFPGSTRNILRPALLVIGGILMLVLFYLIFFQSGSQREDLVSTLQTQAVELVVNTDEPPMEETPMLAATTTPNPVRTLTPTPLPTRSEPASTEVVTPTPLAMFNGSQLGTPVGDAVQYVVHRVAPNESLNYLLDAYHTNLDAFQYVNQNQDNLVLWAGDVLVFPVGKTERSGLLPLTAVYVDSYHLINDFCLEHTIIEENFRTTNAIGQDLWLLDRDQWVLIPYAPEIGVRRSITPTPIFENGSFAKETDPSGTYILHQVSLEKTLNDVAGQYGTTAAILAKINDLPITFDLNAGQILLVIPNTVDVESVSQYSVVHIFTSVSKVTLCELFGWNPETLAAYNILDENNDILENRWLIYPEGL